MDIHVATLLVACRGFGGRGWGDNVLDGTILTIHLSRTDIHIEYMLIRCALFVVHELMLLAATFLMVHEHEVTYMLIPCALFVVHEFMCVT